jgi:voltage-gated potassium channel
VTGPDDAADGRRLTERPDEERHRLAEDLAQRLDVPMTVLGVVFALLVLAETVSRPTGWLSTAFQVTGWLLWAVFVGEFLLRLYIAPSRVGFLKRSWWQLLFLAVPFLRFLRVARLGRLLRVGRVGRVGRIVSAAVRGTRTAGRQLRSRLAWLVTVTGIVVLGSSQVLFEVEAYPSYPSALRAAALAAVAGEPLAVEGPVQLLEVALVTFSVVVFATLAGTIGAYFLERAPAPGATPEAPPDVAPAAQVLT